jgi:PIN domain nuclease of toxin-antitoxin system
MYLLDTHTLLWYLRDSQELSELARQTIDNADYVAVSIASLWEIAIKRSIGKLQISMGPFALELLCRERDIAVLPIRSVVLEKIQTLPKIHRDPFDRLLIAQALENSMTIITRDKTIPQYPVPTIW